MALCINMVTCVYMGLYGLYMAVQRLHTPRTAPHSPAWRQAACTCRHASAEIFSTSAPWNRWKNILRARKRRGRVSAAANLSQLTCFWRISWRRFCQMMWRLNFLVLFCCIVLRNDYMLYYICPMHTLFTVRHEILCRLFSHLHSLPWIFRSSLRGVEQ